MKEKGKEDKHKHHHHNLLHDVDTTGMSEEEIAKLEAEAVLRKYDKESDAAVMYSLKKLRYKLRGKAAYGELMELTADIRLKGENASFVESINSVEGVKSAVLVEYTGD